MNIFDLILYVLQILCAIIGWHIIASGDEVVPRVLGAVAGFLLPVAFVRVAVRIERLYLNLRPPRPMCENCICRWDDYSVRYIDHIYEYTCKCGRRYVMTGRRFQKLHDDGHMEPYSVLGTDHQWHPEPGGQGKQ